MGSSLEALPIELHKQILLLIIDRPSLRSLIHASLPFRQAYFTERARLHLTINPKLLSSALFAQTISEINPGLERKERRETVQRLLKSYPEDQSSLQLQISTLDGLYHLVYTQNTIDRLTSDLHLWFEITRKPTESAGFSFSPTEHLCVQRALYVYTIWTRLYGPERLAEEDQLSSYHHGKFGAFTDGIEKAHMFLSRLPHSETNELALAVEYIRSRYVQYFSEIQEDQDRDAVEDEDLRGSVSETGFEDLNPDGDCYRNFLDTVTSLGPDFLSEVLQTADRQIRRDIITKQLFMQPDSIRESLLVKPDALALKKNWELIILEPGRVTERNGAE